MSFLRRGEKKVATIMILKSYAQVLLRNDSQPSVDKSERLIFMTAKVRAEKKHRHSEDGKRREENRLYCNCCNRSSIIFMLAFHNLVDAKCGWKEEGTEKICDGPRARWVGLNYSALLRSPAMLCFNPTARMNRESSVGWELGRIQSR